METEWEVSYAGRVDQECMGGLDGKGGEMIPKSLYDGVTERRKACHIVDVKA